MITDLARFTGFEASLIDRKTLAIPMPLFSEQLLRSDNRIVGRYDSRLTAPFDPEQVKMYDPTKDPSLSNIIDDVAVLRYLRSELEVRERPSLSRAVRRRLPAADDIPRRLDVGPVEPRTRWRWRGRRATAPRRVIGWHRARTATSSRNAGQPVAADPVVVRVLRSGLQLLRQSGRGRPTRAGAEATGDRRAVTAAATPSTQTTPSGES